MSISAFSFKTVPSIELGIGKIHSLGDLAKLHGMQRPFVVTDAGIVGAGLLDVCVDSLKKANLETTLYTEVVADPPEHVVLAATQAAIDAGCDGVIGYGGGSSMDVAKLIAVLIQQEQPLEQMYGVDNVRSSRAPLLQIPTTAGTGSEVTAVAIVTTGEFTKAGVVSPSLYADAVILDPELTVGLPAHVTAATGIDAMVHAIEAYTSKRLKNPLSDMLALQALKLMTRSIRTAVFTGKDINARTDMLLGAMLAGQAFANSPVGAVHALAYPLGGIYHIPHGLINSLVLPHVLRFNAPVAGHLYKQLAEVILYDQTRAANETAVTEQLAEHFLSLAAELGLQTTLQQMNIKEDGLDELAEQSMLQERLLINNPREVTLDDAKKIYQAAF